MIDFTQFWIFLGGALLLNITPGQDMAFTIGTAGRGGKSAGLAAAAGVGAGSLAWSLIAAAGLGAAVAASAMVLKIIQVAGAFYLFYLAVRIIIKLDAPIDTQKETPAGEAFQFGMLTNLLNPKVGLFFLAFLPGFVSPETGPVWAQMLILGAVFSATGFLILCGVAVTASAARQTLRDSKPVIIGLNLAVALLFIAISFRLIWMNLA
jgi:threonine/homoserine/homoserine lactone efflux protein